MKVLALMDRLNVGVSPIFNIVILGTVKQVISVKEWFDDKRNTNSEIGYIYVKGVRTSGKNV